MISGSNPEPNLRFPPTSSPNFSEKRKTKNWLMEKSGIREKIQPYHGYFWGVDVETSLISLIPKGRKPRKMVVLTPPRLPPIRFGGHLLAAEGRFCRILGRSDRFLEAFFCPREKGGSWMIFEGFLLGGTSREPLENS